MTTDSPTRRKPLSQSLVSVVLPLYNELAAIDQLVGQLQRVLSQVGCQFELVFVNDGSTDGSGQRLDNLAQTFSFVRVIHLSRNFGHQPAVQAGLSHAQGDAVILMDSDLQDDPNSLNEMIARWQDGYDVVYAVRCGRKGTFSNDARSIRSIES
jgi:glycosyltransferase involved in cell wall biosynthesis